jgi:hypothetical protein
MHCPDPQSLLFPQALPSLHVGEHAGDWQMPPLQIFEPQSEFAPQCEPSVQRGAHPGAWQVPLQCVEPHWLLLVQATPSSQLGAHEAHSPAVQIRLAQSPLAPQALPVLQTGAHAGAAHVPSVHTRE